MMFRERLWASFTLAMLLALPGGQAIGKEIRCHNASSADTTPLSSPFVSSTTSFQVIAQSELPEQRIEDAKRMDDEESSNQKTRNGKDMRKFYIKLILLKATS